MLNRKITRYLGDAPFWRTCLRLALPIAVQNILISSFALVDTAMVSQLGDIELAAVGMAGQWVFLLNIFLFGVASGASVFLAQYWGIRDMAGIHRVTGIAFFVSCVIMLPILLIPLISSPFVISLFNRNPDVIAAGAAYLSIALWSYPAIMLNSVVSATLRSTECVNMPMVISGVSTLANAGLNYIFIFGLGFIPAMGVEGAAMATVVSAWLGPILLILFAILRKTALRALPSAFLRFTKKELRAVLKRMIPVICNEGLWGLGTWTVALIYANLGESEYAGVTIFKNCESIAFAFIQGLGAACCVSIGKSVGSGKIADAVRDGKRFSIVIPLVSIAVGGLLLSLRAPILAFFNLSGTLSAVTLATAAGMILLYCLELPIRNIPYVQIVGVFRSGGDTLAATLFDVGCLWAFAIPAGLIAAKLGAPFLLVVLIIYLCEDWPKAALCLWRFHSGKWIKPVTKEGIEGHKRYLEQKKKV